MFQRTKNNRIFIKKKSLVVKTGDFLDENCFNNNYLLVVKKASFSGSFFQISGNNQTSTALIKAVTRN